ncbi:hypothetical protein [Zhihengliuella sp. ISTPL4]|uniref:hypothetical protein n=1 Tax=Zhihengliuella sp. ISTPL4 TaxID=2058657 RepID=UPI000C7D8C05|nr:hypothetical protein [Zhihengliuella sp. ISTPL4]
MGFRTTIRRLNDANSITHGVVATALTAGLAAVEPRRLTTGRRVVYRSAIAALTAWTVWASLRPADEPDFLGPIGRGAVAAGAGGTAFGLAEAGEALDARLRDGLGRAGARRPRLWLVAGQAILSLGSWWVGRQSARVSAAEDSEDAATADLVEIPTELRALAELLLSATDDHGAPALRAQLAEARLVRDAPEEPFWPWVSMETASEGPRAVPGTATFPVLGRFRALDDRTFDVRLRVEGGRIDGLHVDEGADWTADERARWDEAERDLSALGVWPTADAIDLFIETPDGYRSM